MLTKQDITTVRKVVREEFNELFDEKFAEVRIQLQSDIAQFKDDILSVLHPLDEDHTVLVHQVRELNDTTENHENRIQVLEKGQASAMANV